MEFSQKLQILRKTHNMTQEQLANQLFVSRTAISKWESDRGYPNLESIKAISKLFCISIDDLLSDEALVAGSTSVNHKAQKNRNFLIFSLLDLATLAALFLPLFKAEVNGILYAVPLLHTNTHLQIAMLYCTVACGVWGLIQFLVLVLHAPCRQKLCRTISLSLSAGFSLLLIAAQQPYATVFLLAILLGKQFAILRGVHDTFRIAPVTPRFFSKSEDFDTVNAGKHQYYENEVSNMKKTQQARRSAGLFFALFLIFTLLLRVIDVQAIGPLESSVGFATINGWFHELTGVNLFWYELTNKLGMLALASAGIFALVGLFQLIQRKSLRKVDGSLYILAVYYAVVLGVYVFFEFCVVNCRPVLMDGQLEASYPSSHTMLSICFMMAAIAECKLLMKNRSLCHILQGTCIAVMIIMVIGRLISGVHWFTDILGGLLISVALVSTHQTALSRFTQN